MVKYPHTKFINSLYLTNLIQNRFGDSLVKIKKYEAVLTASGVNPSSTPRSFISRVMVKYSSKENPDKVINLVIKIKPEGEEYKNSDAFKKEVNMYKSFLPKMCKTVAKINDGIEFAPRLIHSADIPYQMLIFEDLSVIDFASENQEIGLNLEQSKFALEKLAFFHAASAILLNQDPESFEIFNRGTFHQDFIDELYYFKHALQIICDNGHGLGIDQQIIQKLKKLPSKAVQRAINEYTSDLDSLKVLNHGEFWTNNILFKYDGPNLNDVIFVDFQSCVVGSPFIDLIFFLTTSVSSTVLEESKDELIYTYYETLKSALIKLEYPISIPSITDFQMELMKRSTLELIFTLTVMPYMKTKGAESIPPTHPNLYKLDKTINLVKILENHSAFMIKQLKKYDDHGLLDWESGGSKVKSLRSIFESS